MVASIPCRRVATHEKSHRNRKTLCGIVRASNKWVERVRGEIEKIDRGKRGGNKLGFRSEMRVEWVCKLIYFIILLVIF